MVKLATNFSRKARTLVSWLLSSINLTVSDLKLVPVRQQPGRLTLSESSLKTPANPAYLIYLTIINKSNITLFSY